MHSDNIPRALLNTESGETIAYSSIYCLSNKNAPAEYEITNAATPDQGFEVSSLRWTEGSPSSGRGGKGTGGGRVVLSVVSTGNRVLVTNCGFDLLPVFRSLVIGTLVL